MKENLSIAHMLCSRLCHDIIAPLSAVSTGLELFEENASSQTDEILVLLKKSAIAANQCLSLFRLVFGDSIITHCSSIDQLIGKLQEGLDAARFQLTIAAPTPTFKNDNERISLLRTVACLTLCATEMAPYGGRIAWSAGREEEPVLKLTLEGATLILSAEMTDSLTNCASSIPSSPRTICAYLAAQYAKSIQRKIKIVQATPQVIMIALSL